MIRTRPASQVAQIFNVIGWFSAPVGKTSSSVRLPTSQRLLRFTSTHQSNGPPPRVIQSGSYNLLNQDLRRRTTVHIPFGVVWFSAQHVRSADRGRDDVDEELVHELFEKQFDNMFAVNADNRSVRKHNTGTRRSAYVKNDQKANDFLSCNEKTVRDVPAGFP